MLIRRTIDTVCSFGIGLVSPVVNDKKLASLERRHRKRKRSGPTEPGLVLPAGAPSSRYASWLTR